MMTLLAPAAGTYVAVNAHAEDWHIRQRIEGFRSYFAEASGKGRTRSPGKPGIAVRDCFDIEEPAALEAFMKGLIEREDGMGGILVANSSGHLVGEWLARSGRKKGCAVVTWDLVPANERGLRDGSVDCVVSQRPYAQARVALATLVRHVTGVGADPGRIDIPIELWFRENLPAAGAEERGEL
jgi:LacI family transcriptional regulator